PALNISSGCWLTSVTESSATMLLSCAMAILPDQHKARTSAAADFIMLCLQFAILESFGVSGLLDQAGLIAGVLNQISFVHFIGRKWIEILIFRPVTRTSDRNLVPRVVVKADRTV